MSRMASDAAAGGRGAAARGPLTPSPTSRELRLAAARVGHDDLCVRTRLEVSADAPLSADRLLRRLEVTRQALSVRWCGRPGSFAGYDVIDLPDPFGATATVVFTAILREISDRSHVVELTATDETTGAILVKGRGRTLETPTRSDLALGSATGVQVV